jgi:hypothetical protein
MMDYFQQNDSIRTYYKNVLVHRKCEIDKIITCVEFGCVDMIKYQMSNNVAYKVLHINECKYGGIMNVTQNILSNIIIITKYPQIDLNACNNYVIKWCYCQENMSMLKYLLSKEIINLYPQSQPILNKKLKINIEKLLGHKIDNLLNIIHES